MNHIILLNFELIHSLLFVFLIVIDIINQIFYITILYRLNYEIFHTFANILLHHKGIL